MARITFPERGLGEHIDWALMRPEMAVGMGALSTAVYENTKLALREREAARWTIALINDCVVCRDTRARDGERSGIDDGFYAEVASWRTTTALTDRERLAAATAAAVEAAGLIGSPEEIVDKLGRYVEAGVRCYEMKFIYHTIDDYVEQMQMFAERVIPTQH